MNINRSSVFLSCDKNGGSFKLGLDVDRRYAFCCFYRWLPSDTLELYLNVSLLPDHFDAHSKPINNIHAVIFTSIVFRVDCGDTDMQPRAMQAWLCLLSTSTFSTGASRSSDVLPSSAERPHLAESASVRQLHTLFWRVNTHAGTRATTSRESHLVYAALCFH